MAKGIEPVAVVFRGADLRKEMREFAPDLLKAMDKEILKQTNIIKKKAQVEAPPTPPLSGWRDTAAENPTGQRNGGWPAYQGSEVKRGIRVKQGRKRKRGSLYSNLKIIVNLDAAGNIFELAGRKSSGKTPTGRAMIAALNRKYGRASRVVWRAVDAGRDPVTREIADVYERYEKLLNARLRKIARDNKGKKS